METTKMSKTNDRGGLSGTWLQLLLLERIAVNAEDPRLDVLSVFTTTAENAPNKNGTSAEIVKYV